LNSHQRKTLSRVLASPAAAGIRFADIESLLGALGFEVTEGKGSRVRFDLKGEQ
jgi:hypothetical protein